MIQDAPMFDTSNLDEFLIAVQSRAVDLIYTPNGVQSVFHYTDLGGLAGIVANQDLWLTHARFSNDDEEMTHGYGVARRAVEAALSATDDPGEKEYLQGLLSGLADPEPEAVYICCFCTNGDLLSQWRGYGANGTGVSLEFDPTGFDFTTGGDSPPFGLVRFWSVFYEPGVQTAIMEAAIAHGQARGIGLGDKVRRALEAIRFFIPTFKDPRFEEEGELRLIFTPNALASPPAPDFRVARGMLVPYYRLQALTNRAPPNQPSPPAAPPAPHPLPLRGVRVGPSPNKRMNAQSARMLLSKHGMAHVPVEVSSTPFRG